MNLMRRVGPSPLEDRRLHELFGLATENLVAYPLATALDDVLARLVAVSRHLAAFELVESPEPLRRLADILVTMALEIERACAMIWRHSPDIAEAAARVCALEEQADVLYSAALERLFRTDDTHVLEVAAWKDVFQGLEDTCDGCKRLTHVVLDLVA